MCCCDGWAFWRLQALAFLGGEHEVWDHIEGLILQLIDVVAREYQVTASVRVKILLKFFLGDHKAMGIVLAHKMGMLEECLLVVCDKCQRVLTFVTNKMHGVRMYVCLCAPHFC